MMNSHEIDALRRKGVRWIAIAGWGACIALALLSIVLDQAVWPAFAVSVILNIIPTLCAFSGRHDGSARIAVAVMAALQPALLLYAMRGAAWQLDMHMYFFVALAMLTILCDLRAIIVAATAVAVHHLILAYTVPEWVFSGGGGLGRVAIHALAVVLQAGALCFIALQLRSMIARVGAALTASEAAKRDATEALEKFETERGRAEQVERDQAERRQAELLRIANDFETSVAQIATSVADSAQVLDEAMTSLDDAVRDTEREAGEVASAASQVSSAVESVARGVAELSRSITNIATTVGQQDRLAHEAGERSQSGGRAVGTLSTQSRTIGETTKSIASVAEKTNMLALNAAIEAASAGDAGKSFAVVAQEVKDLAAQAANATRQIDELLTEVRTGSGEAESSFGKLSEAIAELARSAATIRNDVETHRGVASSIDRSAGETALGSDEMARLSAVLANRAIASEKLSGEARRTVRTLIDEIGSLRRSASQFVANIKAA